MGVARGYVSLVVSLLIAAAHLNAGELRQAQSYLNTIQSQLTKQLKVPDMPAKVGKGTAGKVVLDKSYSVNEVKNSHYSTFLSTTLGRDRTVFIFSGQEEMPETRDAFLGPMSMLLVDKANNTPHVYSIGGLKRSTWKDQTLGGSKYTIDYYPAGWQIHKSEIELTTNDPRANPIRISTGILLKAIYDSSILLSDNGKKVPIRFGYFAKRSSLENRGAKPSYWLMLLKDGMGKTAFHNKAQTTGHLVKNFKRMHIDTDELNKIKANQWTQGDPNNKLIYYIPYKFEGYTLNIGYVWFKQTGQSNPELKIHFQVIK